MVKTAAATNVFAITLRDNLTSACQTPRTRNVAIRAREIASHVTINDFKCVMFDFMIANDLLARAAHRAHEDAPKFFGGACNGWLDYVYSLTSQPIMKQAQSHATKSNLLFSCFALSS